MGWGGVQGGGKGYIRKGNMFWGVTEMQNEEKVFQDKSSCIIAHPLINNITNKTWGIFFQQMTRLICTKNMKAYDSHIESSLCVFCVAL